MVNFKLEGPLFDTVIRVKTMDNKPGLFLLSGVIACKATRPRKSHFEFGLSCGNMTRSQLQPFGKNTKNRISCLKFLVVAVWICTCLDMKYLRIWINKSV